LIAVEKGKVEIRLDKKDEKWLVEAFYTSYTVFMLAMLLSIICPSLTLLVVLNTPTFLYRWNNRPASDDCVFLWITLLPHFFVSAITFFRTFVIFFTPMEHKLEWERLVVKTKSYANFFLYHFLLISILSIAQLLRFKGIDEKKIDGENQDLSFSCVVVLVNWLVSLFLTLLIIRTNVDQWRVSKSLEALEILEWKGELQRGPECILVKVTESMKFAFTEKMEEIFDYLCLGQSVKSIALLYATVICMLLSIVTGVNIYLLFRAKEFTPSLLSGVVLCLIMLHLFKLSRNHIKNDSGSPLVIVLLSIPMTMIVFVVFNVLMNYKLREFALLCIQTLKQKKEYSAIWGIETIINDTSMAFQSLCTMILVLIFLLGCHCFYSIFCYVINNVCRSPTVDD
ncbi:hypothetical protein PFISCL1PPCAC_2325, partial [Pristionchus fissidentatus]